MRNFSDDIVSLYRSQSSSKFGTSSQAINWLDGIDIKRDMEWFVSYWIQIVDWLSHDFSYAKLHDVIHCEAFDVALLEIDPLIWIDVSNSNQYNVFKRKYVVKPIEPRNKWLGEPTSVTGWIAVISLIGTFGRIYEIRVRVNPYDFEIFVMWVKSMYGGASDWVISSYSEHEAVWMCLKVADDSVINLS